MMLLRGGKEARAEPKLSENKAKKEKEKKMKFSKEAWVKCYKETAAKMPNNGASDGLVCIRASLKYIADGFAEDIGDKPDAKEGASVDLRDSLVELIKDIAAKESCGFACNASSAAKVAGLSNAAKAASVIDSL